MTKEEKRRYIIVNYITLLNRFSDEQFNDDDLILKTFKDAKRFAEDSFKIHNKQNK